MPTATNADTSKPASALESAHCVARGSTQTSQGATGARPDNIGLLPGRAPSFHRAAVPGLDASDTRRDGTAGPARVAHSSGLIRQGPWVSRCVSCDYVTLLEDDGQCWRCKADDYEDGLRAETESVV